MVKIEKNLRDISRIIKTTLLNLLIFISIQIYFNKAFSSGVEIIKTGLSDKTKSLGLNLKAGNELVGDQANKLILFIILMSVILVVSTIFITLTYNKMSFVVISTLINSISYLVCIYKPIVSNNIDIESNFIIPIMIMPVIFNILLMLLMRFLGYCVDLMIFGRKLKEIKKNDEFTNLDEDRVNEIEIEVNNDYDDNSEYMIEYDNEFDNKYESSYKEEEYKENTKKYENRNDYSSSAGNRVSIMPGRR